jgi:uncharacterized Zn finger protein (UPF0148 family)
MNVYQCEAMTDDGRRCKNRGYQLRGRMVCEMHENASCLVVAKAKAAEAEARREAMDREVAKARADKAAKAAARDDEQPGWRTFAADEVLAAVEMLERVKPWSARSAAPSFMGTLRDLAAEGDGGVRLSPKQSAWLEMLIADATDKDPEAKWPPDAEAQPQPEARADNVVQFRRRASP